VPFAAGRIVIPHNPKRKHRPCAIGEGCTVKVNVNVGTSGTRCDYALEAKKAKAALESGADAIMDLSTGGNLIAVRKKMLALDTTVGTVPVYEAVRRAGNAADVDADLLFKVIREHCKQGVDFLTLHCGVNRQVLDALRLDPRKMGVVSRGGTFHCAMMMLRDEENPLYAEFDYLLENPRGIRCHYQPRGRDAARLPAGCRETRESRSEYVTLGTLARRAQAAGVQRMIEGPGHMPFRPGGLQCPDDKGDHRLMPRSTCSGRS